MSIYKRLCALNRANLIFAIATLSVGMMFLPLRVHSQSPNIVILQVTDATLAISGQAPINSLITIKENNAVIATTSSNASGQFLTLLTAQPLGIRIIDIFATTPDSQVTDTVSQSINVLDNIVTNLAVFLPTTINISSSSLVIGETATFSGLTIPDGLISLTIDSSDVYTTSADTSGFWQLDVNTGSYSEGTHSYAAVVQDSSSNLSSPTVSRNFSVTGAEETPPEGEGPDNQPGQTPSITEALLNYLRIPGFSPLRLLSVMPLSPIYSLLLTDLVIAKAGLPTLKLAMLLAAVAMLLAPVIWKRAKKTVP